MEESEGKGYGLQLKVCGMREPENIRALFGVRPDMVGLIFYPHSKRYADGYREGICALQWPPGIARVGVFVNEVVEKVLEMADIYKLNWVQLHGHETPRDCLQLMDHGLKVIKAFGVDGPFDPGMSAPYEDCTDIFLFDTSTPQYGGSGRAFNWECLRTLDSDRPFMISGGIDLGMENAILRLAADENVYGIDINSRFETSPGIKDMDRIMAFRRSLSSLGLVQQ
jgi:phosphoribosylanthranilate isomerase